MASFALLVLYLVLRRLDGSLYVGTGASLLHLELSFPIWVAYLAPVLGVTFFVSSLLKASAHGIVLTAVLSLCAFRIVEALLSALMGIERWRITSYAQGTWANVLGNSIPRSWTGTIATVHVGSPGGARRTPRIPPACTKGWRS
ncbi:MAG: hypothetical protein ACYDDF_09710 [Thermoplasmatota archaeon]